MSLKQIFIIVLLAILVGGAAVFIISRPKSSVSPKTTQVVPNLPSPTSAPLLTWTDEAGFSFQYPEGTKFDKHPEDNTNYANLTLTFPDKSTAQIIMSDKITDKVATADFTDNDVMVTITGSHKDMIIKSWQFIYPTPKPAKTAAPASTTSDDVLEEE